MYYIWERTLLTSTQRGEGGGLQKLTKVDKGEGGGLLKLTSTMVTNYSLHNFVNLISYAEGDNL